MRKPEVYYVPTVDARTLPQEVYDWCGEHDISTHYATEIYQLHLDGNPLQLFFEENGIKFTGGDFARGFAEIGVIGT